MTVKDWLKCDCSTVANIGATISATGTSFDRDGEPECV